MCNSTSLSLDLSTIPNQTTSSSVEDGSTPASTPSAGSLRELVKSGNKHQQPMSTGLTLLYLIKSNLGPGLYAIPAAFKDAGIVGGSIGIPLMAALSIHCMHMLVKCTEVMKGRRGNPDASMNYPEVIETACLSGPAFAAKYSTFARRLIKVSLFVKEMAFCSVFLLLAGFYLYQLMSYFLPDVEWSVLEWTCTLSIPAAIMACVRDHEFLHALSYLASAIKAVSLVVVFFYVFQDLPAVAERPAFANTLYMLLFYGTVIFAFEGVTQALPLHSNMRSTRNFRGWNGVLNTGMVIISCLYFALGFYGYLKYGDYTYPSITMNLPKEQRICQVVKVGLIIALLINYGSQLHAAIEITEETLHKRVSCPKKRITSEIGMRVAILVVTVLVALVTTNLDLFLSLVGSLTCTLVCLAFPPMLDIITFWDKMNWARLMKNIFIITLALFAFATGTAACVVAIVQHHMSSPSNYYASGGFNTS